MAVSLGDVVEVALSMEFELGSEQVNVFHLKLGAVIDGADDQVHADLQTWLDNGYAGIAPIMSGDTKFRELRIRNVTDDGPTLFYPWSGTFDSGASGGDDLPPGVSALVLYRTATKRVLGRKYLPTFLESAQSFGAWTPATMDILATFGADTGVAFDGDSSGNNYAPVVWSRVNALAYPIISTQAQSQVAYMRTRRVGRGS